MPSAVQGGIFEPGGGRGIVIEQKLGRQFRPSSALANPVGVGAVTQQQAERINQDRFSGTGLTGDRREPRVKIQREGGDDGEILNVEVTQHANWYFGRLQATLACQKAACNGRSLQALLLES